MGIRFIIGRAGSGKTHRCLTAIRARLEKEAADGPRLLLLVPEQAALQMERAIIAPRGTAESGACWPAAHRAEVLSFTRLAYRILESAGQITQTALTEPARAMVIRHLLVRLAPDLRYYRRVADTGRNPGRMGSFVERLSATASELIQEAIEPDRLDDSGAESLPWSDPAQAAKLHDLALLYRAYVEYLGDGRADPSQYLQTARASLDGCTWLHGAELWVDGFASFSGQERLTLTALARMCGSVEITALMDPEAVPQPGDAQPPAVNRLFSRVQKTYIDLCSEFTASGVAIDEPIVLDDAAPRFRSNHVLARLEQRVFRPGAAPAGPGEEEPAGLEVVALPSRRVEVDYAVSRIADWVHDTGGGYRYRDLALIVRDLEPYQDLISEALRARNIPFFVDRRRPAAHHPLAELLRSAAALAADDLSLDSVRLTLKTGLLPIVAERADELENYLIAHGIGGRAAWGGNDWSLRGLGSLGDEPGEAEPAEARQLERVNETRRRFVGLWNEWLDLSAAPAGHTGPEWVEAVQRLFERLSVAESLREWAAGAEDEGDLDQAEEHRQVWRDTMSFLDDLSFAFAEVRLSIEELGDVLEAGLSKLSLGLVPPTVDQVLVGSIERSRHPDIKAAVVLGFNDGVFPFRAAEDSILNDDDRSLLQGRGVGVGPPARERILDESLLAYIALTRAGRALLVTYATSDESGRALQPSAYLDALLRACPGLAVQHVADPTRSRGVWDVLNARDLGERLALEFRVRPARERDDLAVRGRWNELYESLRSASGDAAVLERAGSSLADRSPAALSPKAVERLYGAKLFTSVSQLEAYAACPFQHFARFALKLRERPEAALAPVDVGKVHHAILEDFVGRIAEHNRRLADLSDGQWLDELEASCGRIADRMPDAGTLSDARSRYLLRGSATHLARVIRAQRRVARAGRTRPKAAELPFGFDADDSLPPVELVTPAGRRVALRGYIDRVDVAELADELLGVVIDYKARADKRLDMQYVYHGLSLQLPAYLLVLRAHGRTLAGRPIEPIGALFVPLAPTYRRVEHPSRGDPGDTEGSGLAKPRGLLNFERFDVLDETLASGRSALYNVQRSTEGRLGDPNRSDAAERNAFDAILEHTRTRLGALADGMLGGDIEVRPYRLGNHTPCSWCPMLAVCRFEMGLCQPNFLDAMKRSDVLARLIGPAGDHSKGRAIRTERTDG